MLLPPRNRNIAQLDISSLGTTAIFKVVVEKELDELELLCFLGHIEEVEIVCPQVRFHADALSNLDGVGGVVDAVHIAFVVIGSGLVVTDIVDLVRSLRAHGHHADLVDDGLSF